MTLAILVGILSTVQLHLAKALQRQGIEALNQIRDRIRKTGGPVEKDIRKPIIYTVGVVLNNTVFIYPLLAQRYAPPAVFTSMFGVGLVALMLYAWRVLREPITREIAAGAVAIVVGTLIIGIENIGRGEYDRSGMAVGPTLALIGAFFVLGLLLVLTTTRWKGTRWIGFAFGFFAGGCGSLDPFLKGVAQNLSGRPELIPVSLVGMGIFISSFIIGFLAFLITQIGFARQAPASVLVPVYNATYIVLPVALQAVLLPSYRLYASTIFGIALILFGVVLMRGLRR
jgi:drug/metabolite transporter (DMT)-like permease